ncbi:ATP-binding cassette sub-family B member 6 [Ischnura elegans]|uniref:ATP-binding cassette sub-family B member 6 n=1 Tax=Ischnura elegans TaxID=197161 RepID=UPI001ED8B11E|nr:ATP-binding cassette sub-family B member 6 [Ischnura elegans]
MLFCPVNISFTDVWEHGTSRCFHETVSAAVCSLIILVFGAAQVIIYRKYATPAPRPPGWGLSDERRKSLSFLYNVQIVLTELLAVYFLVRLGLQGSVLEGPIVGYMILTSCLWVVSLNMSLILMKIERRYMLPSVPTRGHGLVLLVFWTALFVSENLSFLNLNREKEWWFLLTSTADKVEMAFFIMRYLSTLILFVLGLKAPGLTTAYNAGEDSDLIDEESGQARGSTFRNFYTKMKTLAPFLWPQKSPLLQLSVIFCFCLLALGRVINLYVPIYSKAIVDSMIGENAVFRWDFVLLFVAFKFLQGGGTGGMGVLNNLRTFLWISIQQYTTRAVQVELFAHLHGLSLRWHLGRKTGEVLRVMNRGTDSANSLLSSILFSILPTLVDILIAVAYFVAAFDYRFGLIVLVTMTLYIVVTIWVTEWRTKFIRSMNLADNAKEARSVDSLLNFETVKYYNAEAYEVDAYREAIFKFQKEEWKSSATLNLLNTVQNFVVSGGLMAGSLLCVYMVVDKQGLTVGDYVLFSSYILQLYVPLNWFGTYYRVIQRNFIDMENMFDLLREEKEVVDAPGAGPLVLRSPTFRGGGADIEFCSVTFGYSPDRPVLKSISFAVPHGKTVALVGPSGSGKSTIIRLLFRFYDVQGGSILVGGQNVKTVTQNSLRASIGVVPQDTVLFNNSILYNIQYGRVDASYEEMVEAAKHADIHNQILTFTNGYDTVVGERGLKLSGGEKQRVAIARTILKSPHFILLDEATSALDTQTERNIQAALYHICNNRTTLIVAHRLSTIIHADQILVLSEGEIIERGRHEELLSKGGKYAQMWEEQLHNKDAERREELAESPVAESDGGKPKPNPLHQ